MKDILDWDEESCLLCGHELAPAVTIINKKSKWFDQCTNPGCGSFYNIRFELSDYKEDFLASNSPIKGFMGGYGAGKTSTSGFAYLMHQCKVPGGESILGADSWGQMYKTNIKEMNEITPRDLVRPGTFKYNPNPNTGTWQLVMQNGHTSYARVLKSEEALRSLNLSGYWMEEASVISYSIFNQLNTRIRHEAAIRYHLDDEGHRIEEEYVDKRGTLRTRFKQDKPEYMGIISSNPDPGWIRTKVLYKTPNDQLHYYGTDPKILKDLIIPDKGNEKNPSISTFVVPTYANYMLPEDFIERNTYGKTKQWIDRYINGAFTFAEGMVYPSYAQHAVEPFEIPKEWKAIIVADFGRRDPTAYLLGRIDPDNDILYITHEFYMPEGNISDWVQGFWDIYNQVPKTSWLMGPVGDPAGQSRGQAIETSSYDIYADHEIYFIPANTGKGQSIGQGTGISLVNDYFEVGKIKYFNTLINFTSEIKNYRYKTKSLMEEEDEKNKDEKPIGYKDHLMDCLRMLVSMLPRKVTTPLSETGNVVYDRMSLTQVGQFNTDELNDPNSAAFWAKPKVDDDPYSPYHQDAEGVLYGNSDGDFDGLF